VKSGCPATDISPHRSGARFAAACLTWRAEAIRRIAALRPSVVFIGNATNYLRYKDTPASRFDVSLDEGGDGTRRTREALTSAGLRVAVVRDNPRASFDIPTCLARAVRHSWYPVGSCEIDKSTCLNPAVFEAEKAGARGLPNVHLIDLTDRLCQGNVCWAARGGAVMYRDNNHLTGSFADSLMPVLESELIPILNAAR